MLGTAECSDERSCPAHSFWTAHRGKTLEFLRRTCVADVAAFEARRRWKLTVKGVVPPEPGPSAAPV